MEKQLEHRKKLFRNFIDYKKAFDRVWRVLKEYNIDDRLVEVIRSSYDEATGAVLLNESVGEFFRTTLGVQQGCPLSSVLFNIFLAKIMQKALTHQHLSENDCFAGDAVSIGG